MEARVLWWGSISSIWFLVRQSDGRRASHSLYRWWWHSECIHRQSVSIAAVSCGMVEIFLLLSAFLCERCDQRISDNVWLRIAGKKSLFYSALLIEHNLLHADDYLRYDEHLSMDMFYSVWYSTDYLASGIISSTLFPSSCWLMPRSWDQRANIQPAILRFSGTSSPFSANLNNIRLSVVGKEWNDAQK